MGVGIVDRTEISVLFEGREVGGWVEDVAVEWAGVEFCGGAEGGVDGSHEGVGDGPVIAEVEVPALGVDSGGAGVVSLKEG